MALNWVMMGSSGQSRWTEAPLTQRNTPVLDGTNTHIKSMLSPRHFIQAHPHFPFADRRRSTTFRLANGALHEYRKQPADNYHARAFTDDPSEADACLYHYNFKSVEEFARKVSRNRGDFPMSHGDTFDGLDNVSIALFVHQHRAAGEGDRVAGPQLGLDRELARLRALPSVAEAERGVVTRFRQRLAVIKGKLLADGRLDHLGPPGEQMRALLQQTSTEAEI